MYMGGVPAHKIMSLDDFIEKRRKMQIDEAVDLARAYKERFGMIPDENVFFEYFMLFKKSNDAMENQKFEKQMNVGNSLEKTLAYYENYVPPFNSFNDFINYCFPE